MLYIFTLLLILSLKKKSMNYLYDVVVVAATVKWVEWLFGMVVTSNDKVI